MMTEYPTDLLDFYNQHKEFSSPVHATFQESKDDSECAFYPIKFDFDADLLLKECQSVDDLFFNHRSKDAYGHLGWQSLTLHGLDKHKTNHFTSYGFKTLEEADYHWTDVCEQVPNLYNFLSKLPYSMFERVRIMRLAPHGYIMPHTDGPGRIFSPLNIAINNPDECYFVFENKGIVPFVAGNGMVIDVARQHIVANFSDTPRYHVIVHGYYNENFNKL